MTKLKLGPLPDDKPVKVMLELPATLNRDIIAYAEVLARQSGQPVADPAKLIVPMLQHFIATDRGFAKARRAANLVPSRQGCRQRIGANAARYRPLTSLHGSPSFGSPRLPGIPLNMAYRGYEDE